MRRLLTSISVYLALDRPAAFRTNRFFGSFSRERERLISLRKVSLLGKQCHLLHLTASNKRMIVATDNIQKSVVRNCGMWVTEAFKIDVRVMFIAIPGSVACLIGCRSYQCVIDQYCSH